MLYNVVCALHTCGVWNLAGMKTLGTLHSNYTHVVACLRKGVLGSLRYRFAIVFMPCASWKTMWHDNAAAQGYSGPSPSTSVQAYTTSRIFCFLIVLQGIEHAFRKTDMRILISYMGGFYTLSVGMEGVWFIQQSFP